MRIWIDSKWPWYQLENYEFCYGRGVWNRSFLRSKVGMHRSHAICAHRRYELWVNIAADFTVDGGLKHFPVSKTYERELEMAGLGSINSITQIRHRNINYTYFTNGNTIYWWERRLSEYVVNASCCCCCGLLAKLVPTFADRGVSRGQRGGSLWP
jgi:hypothetical protein